MKEPCYYPQSTYNHSPYLLQTQAQLTGRVNGYGRYNVLTCLSNTQEAAEQLGGQCLESQKLGPNPAIYSSVNSLCHDFLIWKNGK